MSRLTPADVNNVIDLIQAVFATPNVTGYSRSSGVYSYAFSIENITLSYQLLFPSGSLNMTSIADLLLRGSRSGVFKVLCASATNSSVSRCDSSVTSSEALYNVNMQMARVNPANKVYTSAFNAPAPPVQVGVYNNSIDAQISTASNFTVGGGGSPIGSSGC
jgi:hypothetical protein